MKTKLILLLAVFAFAIANIYSQDVTTVTAKDSDISDNLDLEAVASVFGESTDLKDFEKRLNDPETRISNLDLNGDGEVDYLRVIETSDQDIHLVTIQAVIGKDTYQDVAVVSVEKDNSGQTQVQVVGDVYMYGPDYIITPVYVQQPVVVVWFWGPYYNPWYSPYYWDYYPPYYSPWRPYPPYYYRSNVYVYVNTNNTYRRSSARTSPRSVELQNNTRRNDYGTKHPDRTFTKRNPNATNRQDLNNNRGNIRNNPNVEKRNNPPTKKVQENWKPASGNSRDNNVKNNNYDSPSRTSSPRDTEKPSARPSTTTPAKPSSAPSARPSTNPSTKPASGQPNKASTSPPSKSSASPTNKPGTSTVNRPAASPPNKTTTSQASRTPNKQSSAPATTQGKGKGK